ncbi:hypothetical protein CY34DRAFT_801908 [Suillus luteus UH-Slu-Lm8-n1]|uniref:Uncharacterized protein n=1 Tax=Suillus luteus UH-Slu-Lm8-n1 TaxID=930992 RepID=A0A0D0A4Z6_9AGAM|nr:hypothetical protein CY34DRAFT_801908 [Suillus luteus UH-Slu-Lm8-n1]
MVSNHIQLPCSRFSESCSPDSRISVLPLRNYFRRVVHAFDYFPHTGTGCISRAMRVHPFLLISSPPLKI